MGRVRMRTAGIALALFAALLFLPSLIQRTRRLVQRIRHRRTRAQLRAAVLEGLRIELADASELAASLESLNAALWRANDDLVNKLEQRMTDDERAELQRGLTIYDRLLTDVMDRATWGDE